MRSLLIVALAPVFDADLRRLRPSMSASGTQRTSCTLELMSAIGGKVDIPDAWIAVRFCRLYSRYIFSGVMSPGS